MIKYRHTITLESEIAISPREWEQLRELLEDIGYENVTLSNATIESN